MSSKLGLLALAASLLLPVAAASAAGTGYFDTAGAPLTGPTEYNTGNAAATTARQKASGYYDEAGAPMVQPTWPGAADAAKTLERQRASGYFPEAGAPMVAPAINER